MHGRWTRSTLPKGCWAIIPRSSLMLTTPKERANCSRKPASRRARNWSHAPIGRYLKGEETSEYVAAQLKEVGVKVKVQLHEWNAYRKLGRIPGNEAGAFDLKYGWNSNEWFDASRIVSHITCDGTSSKLCNKKIDELMDRAIKTLDQKARDKQYQEVWALLNKDPHAIYLLQQNLIYGLSKRLEWQPRLDDEVRVITMRLTE